MENIFAQPLFYVSAAFAVIAALGFLLYLRGFIGGIGDVFTLSGHAHHVEEAQIRAVWGVSILTAAFVVWEIIRGIANWLFL